MKPITFPPDSAFISSLKLTRAPTGTRAFVHCFPCICASINKALERVSYKGFTSVEVSKFPKVFITHYKDLKLTVWPFPLTLQSSVSPLSVFKCTERVPTSFVPHIAYLEDRYNKKGVAAIWPQNHRIYIRKTSKNHNNSYQTYHKESLQVVADDAKTGVVRDA